jgi:hypothetical protein
MTKAFKSEQLEPLILRIRGRRVVLDADLARLYGTDTGRFNQTFKRNRHRFPNDFAFQLTAAEVETLRSQIVISNAQALDFLGQMSSKFAITSRGGRRYLPWAFTEH